MQLDREDGVPPGSTPAPSASVPLPLGTPAAWFADAAPPVPVIVKKRRLLDRPQDGAPSTPGGSGHAAGDDRRPRVFVLPKEASNPPTEPAAGPALAEPASTDAAPPLSPALRRRRRRLPEQRPSPVVHIVMPRPEPPPPPADDPAASADGADGFVLELPSLEAWRDVQAALAGVRRLVQDAEHARGWGLAAMPRPRRPRGA